MLAGFELIARALCESDGRRKPDDLEPGNSPYPWDDEVVDAVVNGEPHFYVWRLYVGRAQAATTALHEAGLAIAPRKLIADAADYLIGDAEAWEKGSDGSPREVYLKHCGKLRRDLARQLRDQLV